MDAGDYNQTNLDALLPDSSGESMTATRESMIDTDVVFADLRNRFLEETGADRCTIELDPEWRKAVGHWLGNRPHLGANPVESETRPGCNYLPSVFPAKTQFEYLF